MDRLERGLTERIYLLSAAKTTDSWTLEVEGSSGKVYKTTVSRTAGSTMAIMKCGCPDYYMRKKTCKHLFFLLHRVAQMAVDETMTTVSKITIDYNQLSDQLVSRLSNRTSAPRAASTSKTAPAPASVALKSDDDCPICFETMKDEKLTQCQITCHNYFHESCISRWTRSNNTCPLCRSPWVVASKQPRKVPNETASSGVSDELQYLTKVSLRPKISLRWKVGRQPQM